MPRLGTRARPDSLRYFHYPPTVTEAAAQYTFRKMIQFSPRGECGPQNDNYEMRAVIEVGLQQTHGTIAPALADPKIVLFSSPDSAGTLKFTKMRRACVHVRVFPC